MNYLNIKLAETRTPDFLGSEHTDIATWLKLAIFCADQENGGRIGECREWPDNRLMHVLRVTREQLENESPLWTWEGTDLVLWGYPVDQEKKCQKQREAGKRYGRGMSKQKSLPHDKPSNSLANTGSLSLVGAEDSPPRNAVQQYTEDFLEFWKAYPRKKGKGDAFKAWKRIKELPDVSVLIAAVSGQRKSDQWKREGGRFIPYPATWLNARQWEDEPEEMGSARSGFVEY